MSNCPTSITTGGRPCWGFGLVALTSAMGAAGITAWNLLSATHRQSIHVAGLSPLLNQLSVQGRLQLSLSLGLLSLLGLTLVAVGFYARATALIADIRAGRRRPLAVYSLSLPLAGTAFLACHVFLSNAFLLGIGCGLNSVWSGVGEFCGLAWIGALALPFMLTMGSGRKHPLRWRLAAMLAVAGVPGWLAGAALSSLPLVAVLAS